MNYAKTLNAVLTLWIILTAIATPIANAQSEFDVTAPVISVNEVQDGIAGETQVFTAEVTDDLGLRDVKLYIRYAGQQPYASMNMQKLGETDFYSVNVATDASETRTMEYYVQARDEGGNRVIKGFAFEPLLRALLSPDAAAAEQATQAAADQEPALPPVNESTDETATESAAASTSQSAEKKASAGKLKWWHIALGVLAAGALAAAAGGGSDSDPETPSTVPVTITISQP